MRTNMNHAAVVVGSGIAGLTTAIQLQAAGWRVGIWTAGLPLNTTSAVAAAIWLPFKAAPEHLILEWSRSTFSVFQQLANDRSSGVFLREGVELCREHRSDPWWKTAVLGFARCHSKELPTGYHDAYRFTVPVIEMPIFLTYLLDRFLRAGGTIEERRLNSLQEALSDNDVVVNCTGLGARQLLPDHEMSPVRGQVVRVRNPGLERFTIDFSDERALTYIIPRTMDCILGGTTDEGCFDTTPDQDVTDAILARAIALEPKFVGAEVLEQKVGLRPYRPIVRLEREDSEGGQVVIHNYGHGGSGVTCCWGCAQRVVHLLEGA
jgi:D-amino-acid oxidase